MASMTRRDLAEIKGMVNELVVVIRKAEAAMDAGKWPVIPTTNVTELAGKTHELSQRVHRHRSF